MILKFDELVSKLQENRKYQLNEQGQEMLNKFHGLIQTIEQNLIPVLTPYVKDPNALNKQIALQIISSINSQQLGTESFELMTRLDTLTNGGKTPVDSTLFTFNPSDSILKYLDIAES